MCPFRTDTDPNRFRYDSARSLSSVPHPHSGYTDHSGMCANTTIGVLLLRRLTSLLEPFELLVAERAQAASFEIDDVHEADEVHAAVIEAVPARALRALAESLQVALPVVFEHVVLARERRTPEPTAPTAPAGACRTPPASTDA